jgi:sentrin-specific protease 1
MKFVGVSVVRSFYVQNIHSSYLVLQDNMFCSLMSLSVDAKILRRNFVIDLLSYEDNSCRYAISANIQQRLIDIAKKD